MFTYEEACNYINELGKRGSILGLSRMEKLLEIMGNPEKSFKTIHIAGTNGKGSTACFIETVLRYGGYKTGMYYSPALCGIKDHYRVMGELITDDLYAKCVEYVKKANDKLKECLMEEATQFEVETAIAFYYFYLNRCDFVVLETGLGGRDDATNVGTLNKCLSVITSVSYDHMDILGSSLYEIATCKAGIISRNCPVVVLDSGEEVIEAVRKECFEKNSEMVIVSRPREYSNPMSYEEYKDIKISLEGDFQRDNACVALESIHMLCKLNLIDINEESVKEGMKRAYWPYRFEKINDKPLVYLDGAHNEDAANRLATTIKRTFADKKVILVMGMFKDKEYEKVIKTLASCASLVYAVTTLNEERALLAEKIKDEALRYCDKSFACESVTDAARDAINNCDSNGVIICCGSLSYLSAAKNAFISVLEGK